MRIACRKCNKQIMDPKVTIDQVGQTVSIEVECHGEKDSMTMTHEWMNSDPEFVFLIESGAVVGWAFDGERTT